MLLRDSGELGQIYRVHERERLILPSYRLTSSFRWCGGGEDDRDQLLFMEQAALKFFSEVGDPCL